MSLEAISKVYHDLKTGKSPQVERLLNLDVGEYLELPTGAILRLEQKKVETVDLYYDRSKTLEGRELVLVPEQDVSHQYRISLVLESGVWVPAREHDVLAIIGALARRPEDGE